MEEETARPRVSFDTKTIRKEEEAPWKERKKRKEEAK